MQSHNLFTNKYIRTLDANDIPPEKISEFRQKMMDKNKRNDSNGPVNTTVENVILTEQITKIAFDTKFRDTTKFPNPNHFSCGLGRKFQNVYKIELISAEIPNTDTSIKKLPVELQNNIISWINQEDYNINILSNIHAFSNPDVPNTIDIIIDNHHLEISSKHKIFIFNSRLSTSLSITGFLDGYNIANVIDENTIRILWHGGIPVEAILSINLGYPLYNVNLIPGNYTASTITKQMEYQMNLIKRRNGDGQFHYFNIQLNNDTNIITIESVITKQLIVNPISTTSSSTIITVSSVNHGLYTGDIVLMINVNTTSGINGNILSGNFTITVLDFNTFTYEVNVPAVSTTTGGGNNVQAGKQAPFQILFDTTNTLIQYNIGFENEDSSSHIGFNGGGDGSNGNNIGINPITTKILNVNNAVINNTDNNYITITTQGNHTLDSATLIQISSIVLFSTGSNPSVIVTCAANHLLQLPTLVTMRNTNSNPPINGDFQAYPNGPTTFIIYNTSINNSGNSGQLVYGGDLVNISGLNTAPSLAKIPFFHVENAVLDTFDVYFQALSIQQDTIINTKIGTSQLTINNKDHSFNSCSSINPIDATFTSCRSFLPNSFIGSYTTNVSIIEGPSGTNTADVLLESHGLSISDTITIIDSTTTPIVNGTFTVQVLGVDELRINFVNASIIAGTGTVITGSKVNITNSNSIPKIDGTFNVINRFLISFISTGSVISTITVNGTFTWNVGDQVTLTNTTCVPSINQTFIIQSISGNTFTILLPYAISSSGSSGIVVNNNTFTINTGLLTPTIPGTNAIIGRNQDIILYRVASDTLNGDTLGGMNLNYINGVKYTIMRLIDTDNYMIRVIGSFAKSIVVSGGRNVYINSVNSGFRSMQSNTTDGTTGTSLSRSIDLAGESYLFMLIPGLSRMGGIPSLLTNSPFVKDVFAKLLLTQSPGLMVYSAFVTAPITFSPIIASIDTLEFKMVTPQNYSFNFNNINYGFTINIYELVPELNDSFVSSRSGSNISGSVKLFNTMSNNRVSLSLPPTKRF